MAKDLENDPLTKGVTFLSDSQSDFASLEKHLQSGAFGVLQDQELHEAQQDLATHQQIAEAIAEGFPWVSPEMHAQLSQFVDVILPTRLDSPMHFRILKGLVSNIKDAANAIGLDTDEFPHYACIPTGLVNASAVKLPNVERSFLLFDSQLFLYCYLFAKSFARCVPIVGQDKVISYSIEIDKVESRVQAEPELTTRLSDVLFAYATTGSPGNAKQYFPEQSYVPLIDVLRDGMELFVVGHEFAHIYAGHLSEILRRFSLTSESFDADKESHLKEHEADCLGLLLTLKAMGKKGYDAGLSYVGVELFFASLDMAARARHIVDHKTDDGYVDLPSESHPSYSKRREILREALAMFISEATIVESMLAVSAQYQEITALLWRYVKASR